MANIANNNLIPKRVLFGNPEKIAPQISPDGKRLAYLAPLDGVMNIWVGDIDSDNFEPLTMYKHKGIGSYFWARNNRYIIYFQDINGDENWHLNSIDLVTYQIRDYTPYANVQAKLAEHDKHYPDDIIFALNLQNPAIHDLYHLDLKTGFIKKIADNPGNFVSWEIDTNLKLRAVVATDKNGGFYLLVREDENSEWKKLIEWETEDTGNISIEGFSKDNNYIYLRDSRNYNSSRLIMVNLKTNETEIIFQDPDYDINFVMINPDYYNIELVSVAKERNQIFIIDQNIYQDIEIISHLNNGDFVIYDRDDLDQKWIVAFVEDNKPASYYLYDKLLKTGKFLFYNKPELNNYQLANMEPFSFSSRDGLTIHGYITFPLGSERKNLPLVLNVHGGPWMRDTWGFNPESQWFANRGYICLQVNFRGSAGYGKDFMNAGDKEWSGKMHDDLIDAINWSIENGYADPKKIAIYGVSYGGYAALVGATLTPETFCCAVDIVGPSNLITMIENIPPYWTAFLDNLKKRVGDPDKEKEFLKSCSPLFKVDNIKIPILIAQGGNDPRVKKTESEQIVMEMIKKDIYHEYLLFPDEGHGITKPENRMKFYSHTEGFLARYLGGLSENYSFSAIQKNNSFTSNIFD